jgi:hypothetical protein
MVYLSARSSSLNNLVAIIAFKESALSTTTTEIASQVQWACCGFGGARYAAVDHH